MATFGTVLVSGKNEQLTSGDEDRYLCFGVRGHRSAGHLFVKLCESSSILVRRLGLHLI
jgi:hypothetical protein